MEHINSLKHSSHIDTKSQHTHTDSFRMFKLFSILNSDLLSINYVVLTASTHIDITSATSTNTHTLP